MTLGQRAQQEKNDLALLTSSRAGDMLRTALAASSHRKLHSWTVHHVHHRPGAGVSVGYQVLLTDRSDVYMLASTATLDEQALRGSGGVTVTLGSTRAHLWEYPHDPELPALRIACDSSAMQKILGFPVNLELLSYRPTRRAVIRIEPTDETSPDSERIFAKVMRPRAQAELVQRLQLLNDSGVPSPQLIAPPTLSSHRQDPSLAGLILTKASLGEPLSRFYSRFKPSDMLQADAMLDRIEHLLDSLPHTAMLFPRKPAWADRCEHYAHAAGLAYPEGAERAHVLAQQIRSLLSQADMGEVTTVHGDMYEANILIKPATDPRDAYDLFEISSLLDADSLGPGYRVHDWGCLLGHLAVLDTLSPSRYRYTQTLCAHWFDELARRVDPVALCASTAGVILSLVAGARKKRSRGSDNGLSLAETRLALAEEWSAAGASILSDPYYGADIVQLWR